LDLLTVLGLVQLAGAVLSLAWGVTTEYRQTRESGPVAIVATLPFGVAAALLATMGTAALLGRALATWIYLVEFAGLALGGGALITMASGQSQRTRR
jgi:hypothetical protein